MLKFMLSVIVCIISIGTTSCQHEPNNVTESALAPESNLSSKVETNQDTKKVERGNDITEEQVDDLLHTLINGYNGKNPLPMPGSKISEFPIGGIGLNEATTYLPSYDASINEMPEVNIELGYYTIDILGDSAIAKGYLTGEICHELTGTYVGPFRFTVVVSCENNDLKIQHIHFSKHNVENLEYQVQLPKNYNENEEWPAILFLHGLGNRGNVIPISESDYGLFEVANEVEDFPFVIITPICPLGTTWNQSHYAIMNMLDEVMIQYNIDPSRIYLTGVSMGGFGTWSLSMEYPDRFAAIAPICGSGNPKFATNLQEVPVWAFHGKNDTIVPIEGSQRMVDALKEIDGNVKFSIYEEAGHEIQEMVYKDMKLYDWFLQHNNN